MNLFEGLEKFGLQLDTDDIFSEKSENGRSKAAEVNAEEKTEHGETEYLLNRTVHCPVCGKSFFVLSVKNGRLHRLDSDFDLRPRFQSIDTGKYDVISCPHCGYTALNRYFPNITAGQIRLVKEGVCSHFKPESNPKTETVCSYEQAVERYKLALFNAVIKKGRISEKAYICLKLSWVYRGWIETLGDDGLTDEELLESCRREERLYYEQAMEGFMKAVGTETFPMCGMDESTMNILLANMAFRLDRTDIASRLVSGILVSRTASAKVKDRARDLKEEIIARIHSGNS